MQRPVTFVLTMMTLVLMVTTGAASSALAQDSGSEPKILRFWWTGEWIAELEPQTNEHGISDLTMLNYEGLTRLDEELNVVPGAAEAWEFDAAGTTITFRLRENLTYSDGSPLTAERFRYAIERRCDPHLTGWGADSLFIIKGCQALNESLDLSVASPEADLSAYEAAKAALGVRAPDARTLVFDLREPAPYFPAMAEWISFIPMQEERIAAGGEDMWLDPANWIGNGPFQIVAIEPEASPARISLVRNERYWGGQAQLDGIEYIIMEEDAAFDAYQQGELDIVAADFFRIPEFEADPVLSRELLGLPTLSSEIFNFNLQKEPFQDLNVRKAFAYAFDHETYCRTIDYTCVPIRSWIPPGVPGSIEDEGYPFDSARARAALAESSYGSPDQLPEIIWYASDDPWLQDQAAWLAAQYQQVLGVTLTIATVPEDELEAMFDDQENWPQLQNTFWWSGLPDPHYWLGYWTCGAEVFAAPVGYCNPDYDALAAAADREMDPVKRITLAEESQRLLLADSPAIFGSTFDRMVLVKPHVTGYSLTTPNQSWPGLATPLTVDIERP